MFPSVVAVSWLVGCSLPVKRNIFGWISSRAWKGTKGEVSQSGMKSLAALYDVTEGLVSDGHIFGVKWSKTRGVRDRALTFAKHYCFISYLEMGNEEKGNVGGSATVSSHRFTVNNDFYISPRSCTYKMDKQYNHHSGSWQLTATWLKYKCYKKGEHS